MGKLHRKSGFIPGPRVGQCRWEVSMEGLSQIGTLTREIVRAIVEHPEEVGVSEVEGTQATVLEVRVSKSDHGRLIGRKGRNVNALRELLLNFGGKSNRRYILEVLD